MVRGISDPRLRCNRNHSAILALNAIASIRVTLNRANPRSGNKSCFPLPILNNFHG